MKSPAPRRFEFTEGTSSKFWEIGVSGSTITTRWGRIGTTGQSKTKEYGTTEAAQKEVDKQIRGKLRKDYVECTSAAPEGKGASEVGEPTPEPAAASAAIGVSTEHGRMGSGESKADPQALNVKREWLSFAEADARCDEMLSSAFEGDYDTVLFVDGDLSIEGDLTEATLRMMAPEGDREATLIAIQGDLTVQGRIALYDAQPSLYVSGHTRAETLEGGDCEIQISSGTFDYFILGYYNDGILATGRVEVPFVINYDHDLSVPTGDAVTVDNYGDDEDYDFGARNIAKSFVSKVIDKEDKNKVCTSRLYEHMKAGKTPLRKGIMTPRQVALAEIRRARDAGLEHLDMSRRKLTSFPVVICGMTGLKSLNLSGNEIGELPPEIGALTHLEVLNLSNQSHRLRELPPEIGALVCLERLNLSGNEIGELPPEIGGLTKLEVLVLDRCKLARLPAEIGKLRNLRKLSLDRTFATDYDCIGSTEANSLLDAGVNPGKRPIELPAEFGDLKALEELDISGQSAEYREIDAEAGADPWKRYRGSRRALGGMTEYTLPDSAGRLARLRKITALGTNLRFPESMHGAESLRELVLGGLERLPDGLETFSGLRRLDLSNNYFTELSARLCELGELEELNLSGSLSRTGGEVPDLSALSKLRVLHFDGSNCHTHEALEKLFTMNLPALEELTLSGWGERENKQEEFAAAPPGFEVEHMAHRMPSHRSEFPRALVDDIGRFAQLRALDLSFNGLGFDNDALWSEFVALRDEFGDEALECFEESKQRCLIQRMNRAPRTLLELEGLERIDLRHNALCKAKREQLACRFPAAGIELRNQKVEGEESPKGRDEIRTALAKEAARDVRDADFETLKRKTGKLELILEALASYDRAMAADDSPGNLLYCLYAKAERYFSAVYYRWKDWGGTKTQKVECVELGIACAEQILPLVPEVWKHAWRLDAPLGAHCLTDEGAFHLEVVRFCGNFIAWELFSAASGPDDPDLQRALELIEHAVACIRLTRDGVDDNRERHIVDTQVRILMKMGRTKDACGVVRELARQNRHLPEFDDILNHPDYWGTLTP